MNGKQIALLIISVVLLGVTSFLGYLYYIQNQEFRIQPITTPRNSNNQEMRINMENDSTQIPIIDTLSSQTIPNSNTNSNDTEVENLEKDLDLETFEDL